MHRMLVALTKLLAPMGVFTADEAWEYIRHKPEEDRHADSVHLALLPQPGNAGDVSEQQQEDWRLVMRLRDDALMQLDRLKKDVGLNKALEAEVIFSVDDPELRRRLEACAVDLADVVGAGHHSFAEKDTPGPAVEVKVLDRRDKYASCARCWKRRPDVGADSDHADLCLRCVQAVKSARTE
jgi:isoleucyl-tRNA synthetase